MKKARLSFLITIMTVFTMFFATSCDQLTNLIDKLKPSQNASPAELIFEVEETVELPYYEYYTVPELTVTDTNGSIYIPKVEVSNENGIAVDFEDGRFFVLYTENYYIKYTVVFNGENVSKTTTGIVADKTAPEVTLPVSTMGAFKGETVTIPDCAYTDNMSAEDEIVVDVKVTYGETEIAVTDGVFTASESGLYKITYAVTDKANNVAEETIELAVVEREEGNIAYLNNEYVSLLVGAKAEMAEFGSRGTGELASPMGGSSTSINFITWSSIYGGRVDINSPAITDVSGYNYLYLWVYTTYSSGVSITYNNVWKGAKNNVEPNVWTRIVFTKGEDGNFYAPATDNMETGATTNFFGSASDAQDIANMADSTNSLFFLAAPVNTAGGDTVSVYFGGFYATNSLPTLPEGTKDWSPAARINVSGLSAMAVQGGVVNPTFDVLYADGAIVKSYVSIDGGAKEEVSFPYAYPANGTYEFTFEAVVDGAVVASCEKSVTVATPEEGNIAYFNHDEWKDMVGAVTYAECYISSIRGEGEKASPMGGTSASVYYWTGGAYQGSIVLNDPVLKDVSGYKYLYLWVYTEAEEGVYMTYNNVWKGTKNYVAPNVWTRIVFTKGADGNFYTVDTDNFESGASNRFFDTTTSGTCPTSLNGLMIAWRPTVEGENRAIGVYFGGLYATNELPNLPAGTKDWSPMPRMNVSNVEGVVETGATLDPSVQVRYADGAIVKAYATIDGGDRQEISLPYTYEVAGTYVLTFEAVLNGQVILTQTFETSVTTAKQTVFTIADFTNADAIDKYSVTSNWGAPLVANYPVASPAGGSGSLQINKSASEGTIEGIYISNPAIKDVSGYNYLFIDVRAGYRDMTFGFYGWQKPAYTIPAQTWVRVVFVNDGNGNFTMPGGSYSTSALGGSSTDITQELLCVQNVQWDYFYLGLFAACNELPAIPEGFASNYGSTTIVDFTATNAISTYNLAGNFEAGIVYDTNANCVRMDSNPYGAYTGMIINNPEITNISKYKYIYVDVKVGWGDANFVFNFVWNTPSITLKGCNGEVEIWTRVVAVNDGTGTFVLPNATGNASGEGQPLDGNALGQGISSANIAGLGFHILSGGNNVYFKNFVACNNLPELPTGYQTNYVA